jgi:hypothetical protein
MDAEARSRRGTRLRAALDNIAGEADAKGRKDLAAAGTRKAALDKDDRAALGKGGRRPGQWAANTVPARSAQIQTRIVDRRQRVCRPERQGPHVGIAGLASARWASR